MSECFLPKFLCCCEVKLHFKYMIALDKVQFTHLSCKKSTVVIKVLLLDISHHPGFLNLLHFEKFVHLCDQVNMKLVHLSPDWRNS